MLCGVYCPCVWVAEVKAGNKGHECQWQTTEPRRASLDSQQPHAFVGWWPFRELQQSSSLSVILSSGSYILLQGSWGHWNVTLLGGADRHKYWLNLLDGGLEETCLRKKCLCFCKINVWLIDLLTASIVVTLLFCLVNWLPEVSATQAQSSISMQHFHLWCL
jgi:hypothetical protein